MVKVCKCFRKADGVLNSLHDLGRTLVKANQAAEEEIVEVQILLLYIEFVESDLVIAQD